MKDYLRLLTYVKTQWPLLLLAIFSMILLAVSTGLEAYLIGPAIKMIFTGSQGLPPWLLKYVPQSLLAPKHILYLLPLLIVLLSAVKGGSYFGQFFLMGLIGQKIIFQFRNNLYAHILHLSFSFYNKTETGTLISRFVNDVQQVEDAVSNATVSILRDSLQVLILITLAFILDFQLAIITFIAIPTMVYPLYKIGRMLRNVSRDSQQSIGFLSNILHETITGIRIVKAFTMEDQEIRRFFRENQKYIQIMTRSLKVRAFTTPFMEFVGAIGLSLTIIYASSRIASGNLSPEAFISFFSCIILCYQPLKMLGRVNNIIQAGIAAAVRIFELMDLKSEMTEKEEALELTEFKNRIELKAVSFQYNPESRPILKNVELSVNYGEIIAICGSSGSGKTTIANLIPRFYDVTSGAITIDGVDIRNLTLKSLRRQISIVTQETILFNDTIYNNILYGQTGEVPREQVLNAAQAAYAHEFILELPKQYQTVIGEKGIILSGGQRQRIAIARALLKNAPILILDEATSSLDSESEHIVQQALDKLILGRTCFIIAHRLSTIRNASRIIVIEDGQIVEAGPFDSLLAQEGVFKKLYHLQFQVNNP